MIQLFVMHFQPHVNRILFIADLLTSVWWNSVNTTQYLGKYGVTKSQIQDYNMKFIQFTNKLQSVSVWELQNWINQAKDYSSTSHL